MNEIIDVECKDVTELADKSTDTLKTETNTLWEQMEAIGAIGMVMAAEAGKRLNIIKSRLQHGEWEDWAKNNLKFSLRKANNMMKLAEKTEDQNSIFANPQSFADIGISKVYALLGASDEVAEEVINNPELPDMTVKELEEKIRLLKEKNAGLEKEMKETADESLSLQESLRAQIDQLTAELKIYEETPAKSEETEKEIADLKAQLEKAKDKLEREKKECRKSQSQHRRRKTESS